MKLKSGLKWAGVKLNPAELRNILQTKTKQISRKKTSKIENRKGIFCCALILIRNSDKVRQSII